MPETVLDRLVVRLTVDLKGLTSGLRKATRQITAFTKKVVTIVKKAAKAFRALGTAVAKMARKVKRSAKIAVVALIAMGVAVVKVASDAQESENLFDVALGRMAKDARDWSESVSQSLGLYSTEIRKNLGTFFLMVNSLGVQKEAALEMAKGLTQLTLDMSSFRNQRFDEMFVKLSGAISGEPEPLGRLGVKILEEQLIIWAKLNGLVDQHATKLNQAQKVIARYNLILERTRKDQGDFARTVGNLAIKDWSPIARHWEGTGAEFFASLDFQPKGVGLTKEQARGLVKDRVAAIRQQLGAKPVTALPWWDHSKVRRDVLVEMAYQLGIGGCLNFKRMWIALRLPTPDYETAAAEMLDSVWAREPPPRGTPERAEELAGIMRSGTH